MRPRRHSELYRDDADFADVACPECRSGDVAVESLFGGAASEVLFRCASCGAMFNWLKWRGALPPTAADGGTRRTGRKR